MTDVKEAEEDLAPMRAQGRAGVSGGRHSAGPIGRLFCVLLGALVPKAATALESEPPPDFSRDVRPLLSDRWFACHSSEEPRAMRVDEWQHVLFTYDGSNRAAGPREQPPRGVRAHSRSPDAHHPGRRHRARPAAHIGLVDRGHVSVGAAAGLAVVDPARVNEPATFEDPQRHPVGIEWVIVNGVIAAERGALTGARPGQFLARA